MRPLARFAFGVVIAGLVLSLVMIFALWRSPSLGMLFAPAETGWHVEAVLQSDIAGGMPAGVTVTRIGMADLLGTDLQHDYDQLSDADALAHYFRTNLALSKTIRHGVPVTLAFEDAEGRVDTRTIIPGYYPIGYFLDKEGALLFAALFCLLTAGLLLRKKPEETAVSVLVLLLSMTALVFTSFAVWSSRLGGMETGVSLLTVFINLLSFNLFPLLFLHFFLLFPKPYALTSRRFLIWMLYLLPLPLILLFELRLFEEGQMLIFAVGVLGGIAAIVHRYVTTDDILVRIQLRWIVFATLAFALVMFLTQILQPLGVLGEAYSYQLPALAFCLIPLSIVVAVLRYKLMQIDSLIDTALLYVALLGVLGALDAGIFWLLASPAFHDLSHLPAFLVALWFSLLLYRPLRNRLIIIIERLLGRSRYDADRVAGDLVKSLLGADSETAVEAETIQTLQTALHTERVHFCYAGERSCDALPFVVERWKTFRSPRYLYELERGLPLLYQTGVAVPMLTGTEHIGVLILSRKRSGQLYSSKDLALLELIASQAALAIGAVRARRESYRQERRARNDREAMLREVHDGIGGIATNINMLAQMHKESPSDRQLRQTLQTIAALSTEALAETRQLLSSLDMSGMAWEEITAEIRRFAQVILQPHGIAFEMQAHLKSASHTSGIVIFTLLRICRETLTNIIKHADATRVDMALEVDAKTVRLQIGDNGSGFDLHDHGKGHGLRSMRKRAELLEGSFAIDSAKGTTVVLSLPVDGTLQGDDG